MSCGGTPHPVNPERPDEHGHWKSGAGEVVPGTAGCRVHTWQGRNALGIPGGPVVKVCTGCGETHWPGWVRETTIEVQVSALTATRGEVPEWTEWLAVEPTKEAARRDAAAA